MLYLQHTCISSSCHLPLKNFIDSIVAKNKNLFPSLEPSLDGQPFGCQNMEGPFPQSLSPTVTPSAPEDLTTTIALQTIQLTTSTISCIASSTIAYMISRSGHGLHSPYRRIIFGLSCADILSSLGFMTGPMLVPRDEKGVNWTIGGPSGTVATCEMNGFILTLGGTAAPMYMCALCIYYLCKVNYSMSDRVFARKMEKPIHFFIVGWSFIGASVALITDNINSVPGGDLCFITSSPVKCEINPLVECERGEHSATYAMIISYAPNIFSFLGITICMARIACKVHYMGRISTIYRRRHVPSQPSPSNHSEPSSGTGLGCNGRFLKVFVSAVSRFVNPPNSNEEEVRNEIVTRSEAIARDRMRETYQQAGLYVIAFFLVYLWPYIFGVQQLIGATKLPFAVSVFFYLLYPFGGLFNILVYTRLKVAIVKRRHPEFLWIQCFWEVIKAGGDAPPRRPNEQVTARIRRRGAGNSSHRNRENRHHQVRRGNLSTRTRSSRATVRRGTRRRDRIDSNALPRSHQMSDQVVISSGIPCISEMNTSSEDKHKSSGKLTCSSDAFSLNHDPVSSGAQQSDEPHPTESPEFSNLDDVARDELHMSEINDIVEGDNDEGHSMELGLANEFSRDLSTVSVNELLEGDDCERDVEESDINTVDRFSSES